MKNENWPLRYLSEADLERIAHESQNGGMLMGLALGLLAGVALVYLLRKSGL